MNFWSRIRARLLSWLRPTPAPGQPPPHEEQGAVVEDWLANLRVVETTMEVREPQPLAEALLAPYDHFVVECGGQLYETVKDIFDESRWDPLCAYWQERGIELPPFSLSPTLNLGRERLAISVRGQALRVIQFPCVEALSPSKAGWVWDESAAVRVPLVQALLLEVSRATHEDVKLWLGYEWVRGHYPELSQTEVRRLASTLRSVVECGHGLIPPEDWWVYLQRFRSLPEILIVPSVCQSLAPLDPNSRLSHLLGALPADFVHRYSAALEPLLRDVSFEDYEPALECRAIEDFLTLWRSPLSPPAVGLPEVCQSMAAQKPQECAFRWLLSRVLSDPRDEFYRLAERSPELLLAGLLRWSHQSPPRLPRFQESALLVQALGEAAVPMKAILEEHLGRLPRVTEEEEWVVPVLREFYRRCSSLFVLAS